MKNESAFPSIQAWQDESPNVRELDQQVSGGGLTKRELFAAMALQGLLSDGDTILALCEIDTNTTAAAAVNAVRYADALLSALKESK